MSKEYHMIATDNPYMAEIGLAAFTSGTLYQWWNLKNGGDYVNRGYFYGLGDSDTGIFRLFEANASGSSLNKYESLVWNTTSRKYENINVNSTFSLARRNGGTLPSTLIDPQSYSSAHIEDSNPQANNSYYTTAVTSPTGVITSIIEHNNLVRLKSRDERFSNIVDWVSGVTLSGAISDSLSSQEAKYKGAFISSIKASASGCVSWKHSAQFNLNLNTLGECVYAQEIGFRLYLYDHSVDRDDTRKISFVNVAAPIVGVPSNAIGQLGVNDGGVIIPSKPVVGELSTQYDQRTGRFRSGTNQVIAVITQDVEAGSAINIADVMSSSTADLSSHIDKLPSGTALPIFMQNGNPELWLPNLRGKRCDQSVDKETVTIYNFATKAFTRGTKVILNEIADGIWIPQDFGAEESVTPTSSIGDNWNFAYLMGNRDNYFRSFHGPLITQYGTTGTNGSVVAQYARFTPETYESEFYKHYYRKMAEHYFSTNAEYFDDSLLSSSGIPTLYVSPIKFRHITSFDYMAKNVGGTRGEKHGVGRTNFSKDLSAASLGGTDGKNLRGYETQFFGCVFPDGYSVDELYREDNQTLLAENDLSSSDESYFCPEASGAYTTSYPPFGAGRNDNIWDSSSPSSATDGMFTQACVDAGYIHLPADIAVHGYDSPIIKYPNLHSKHTLGISTFSDIKEYGDDRWAILNIKNGNSYEDFAYAISVANPAVLQFRPLSMENYAAYEAYTQTGIKRYTGSIVDDDPSTVASFGYYNYVDKLGSTKATTSVYSRNVYRRSDYLLDISPSTSAADVANIVRYGAYSQGFGPAAGGLTSNVSLGCLLPTNEKNGQYNSPDCWDNDFDDEPSHAVGIITAKCDGTTNKSTIDISIQSFLGINNNTSTILGQTVYELNWGGANGISEFDSTELYMKAYYYWPNDLTVFDPRFFSVHHYNYGFNNVVDSYTECDGNWYIDGALATTAQLATFVPLPVVGVANDHVYGDYKSAGTPYWVYTSGTQADYRIPTLAESAGGDFGGSPAPTGTIVYSDTGLFRNPDDWIIEPKARGKLLPFTYIKKTIGVSGNLGLLDSENVDNLTTNTPTTTPVVITSYGAGYEIGDTFTVEGGSGSGVLLDINGVNPDSYQFRVLSAGEGFLPSDFLGSGSILADDAQSSVRLVQVSAAGTGLAGYITRGMVVRASKTISAPPKVISSRRISPDVTDGNVIDRTEEKSIPLTLDSSYTNPYTNKYSFFFHFHNGCSYTLYNDNYQLATQTPNQQHITIDIS